ncbi:hypothetical protein [Marasmitruncus massiliensis]|uniref:hypothetical protein n=1 Tax=Marasmitruncus massiliensis TaxID=1944642 RepID=UPI0015E1095B|nr:hypothetical protein [Marasmitruncus massiliensis]
MGSDVLKHPECCATDGVTPTEVNQFIILALFGVKYAKLVKAYVPWALGVAFWMIVVSTLTGVLPI